MTDHPAASRPRLAHPARTIFPPFPHFPAGTSLGDRLTAILAWYKASRIARTLDENGRKGAPVMAAGMAYMGLFSVFSGVWALFSVVGLVLTGNDEVMAWIAEALSGALPGVIGPDAAIDPSALFSASVFGWTGAISLLSTIWTALSWLTGARTAIRTIFEIPPNPDMNFVLAKLRDLGLVMAALVLVLLSSAFLAAGRGAIAWALGLLGVASEPGVRDTLVEVVAFLIAVVLDAVLLAGIVRVLSQIRVPRRIMIPAALVGGVATVVIKTLATLLVGGATANPLLASFAALLSVLILFNLLATVQLMVATWVKVSMDDIGASPRRLTAEEATVEAHATALRAHREVLAAEELRLREQLRDAPRFTHWKARRRLREIEGERRAVHQRDLEFRMWNGSRPDVFESADDERKPR